jgi:hypothetical protein
VKISKELFDLLVTYHLASDRYSESDLVEMEYAIEAGLASKIDSQVRRELYSKYQNKTLTPAERETARQAYLDEIGMRESFRW